MKFISALIAATFLAVGGSLAAENVIRNTPPRISNIASRIIVQGSSTGALAFTIGDTQTPASSLKLSASSSNTELVPKSNIVFGGSGKNRTVTATPFKSRTGKATITVTVSDGKLSRSDTFVLTVRANTAPTISKIAAQTINENGIADQIVFTIGDAETAASSLKLSASSSDTTLVPNANIVFGGSEANRTVTVKPASGQSGTAIITVKVSDDSMSASDTFVLVVNSGNWFLLGSMNNAANWGRLVSSYGGNIYSYAEKLGGFLKYDPTAKNFSLLPNPPNPTWGSVSLWLNGKYYLIGGYKSSKTVSYDPNTNAWSTLADAPRQGFFNAVAYNGKIYLIGGTGTLEMHSSQCSVYDPSSGWSALPSLPNPRHGAAVVAEGGDIYVIGGYASSLDFPANTVYKFSTKAFSWSELPSMPTSRGYAEAFFDNGYIYVIGGYPQTGSSALVDFNPSPFERYQISDSSWTSLPPLEFSDEYYYYGIIHQNGSLYLPNHAQKYNLALDQWVSILSRPEESSGVPVVLHGKIYLVSRSNTSFSVYEYTP